MRLRVPGVGVFGDWALGDEGLGLGHRIPGGFAAHHLVPRAALTAEQFAALELTVTGYTSPLLTAIVVERLSAAFPTTDFGGQPLPADPTAELVVFAKDRFS